MTTAGNAFSAFGASANNSTSAQLPPYQQQSTPQIPTGITMWKPSPAPSTNTASTVGVAGGDGFYQQQGQPPQLDEVSLVDWWKLFWNKLSFKVSSPNVIICVWLALLFIYSTNFVNFSSGIDNSSHIVQKYLHIFLRQFSSFI
jgi:hypothetical protein